MINTPTEGYSPKLICEDPLIQLLRARPYETRSFAYYVENGKKVYVKVALSEE